MEGLKHGIETTEATLATDERWSALPLESKGAKIRSYFAGISQRYDLMNLLMSFGIDSLWRKRCVRALGLFSGDRVVDLCCGTGQLSAALAQRVGNRNVVGLDFVPEMLTIARKKYPQIEFMSGDALATGLPDESFNGATLAFSLRNVEDLDVLFAEMNRIVRPGGRVLTLELTRPHGLLGVLHRIFTFTVIPVLGWLLAGDNEAYRYLAKSIAVFPSPPKIAAIMRRHGLVDVRIIRLSGGIATIHVATKPSR